MSFQTARYLRGSMNERRSRRLGGGGGGNLMLKTQKGERI